MNINKKLRLSNTQRKSIGGYLFTLPFTLGFIFLFLYPFIQAIIFSLNEIKFNTSGYYLVYKGLENYYYSLFVHTDFVRVFIETILRILIDLPLILSFSFFAAVILNQRFKGRTLARIIFFLPVILASGVVLQIELNDFATLRLEDSGQTEAMFSSLRLFLMDMKMPQVLLDYIIQAVDAIPNIIKSSGIQILIFLAGLQSIPESIYEASDVEGATGWESFWLITLPLMSPLIVTNIVYTIIDSFTSPRNKLVNLIQTAVGGSGYGASIAMSIMYFAVIFILLMLLIKIVSRWVYYQE